LLELSAHALHALLVGLLVDLESFLVIHFDVEAILVFLDFAHGLVRHLQLVRQVVDVALKSFDFGYVVLLFLLEVLDLKLGPTGVLL